MAGSTGITRLPFIACFELAFLGTKPIRHDVPSSSFHPGYLSEDTPRFPAPWRGEEFRLETGFQPNTLMDHRSTES